MWLSEREDTRSSTEKDMIDDGGEERERRQRKGLR
jgi:hypothetical protein